MNDNRRQPNVELTSPRRQPFLLSAALLSGLFLPGLLHPYVKPWVVLAMLIGVALVGRIRPLAQRLSERGRRSGAVRAVVLSCTTVVVVLGSLEYLALALSDLGVVRYLSPMRTVLAPGTEDFRMAHIMADEWRQPDPVLLWRSKSKAPYNRQGFKGPMVETPKPEGVFRLICYGDSNTDGSLRLGDWPQDLQALLDRRQSSGGQRFEVLNAGVAGYSSHQGLLRLRSEVSRFSPDVVLFSFGWNDAVLVEGGSDHEFEPPSRMGVSVQRILLRYRSTLVLRHYLRWPREAATGSKVARVPLDRYIQNLHSVLAIAERGGAIPVFLTRPVRRPPEELRSGATWRSQLPAYNRSVLDLAQSSAARVIDVEKHFRGSSSSFVDLNHFGVEGQREMAALVLRRLVELDVMPIEIRGEDS